MNISLTSGSGHHPMEPEDCNLQGEVDDAKVSLASAGFPSAGPVALISEGPDYPDSYQVWVKVRSTHQRLWIYVDPEGVMHRRTHPTGEDL